jgi:hypothetical protein
MTKSFGLPEMTEAVLKRLLRQFTPSSIRHQPRWRQECSCTPCLDAPPLAFSMRAATVASRQAPRAMNSGASF